MRKARFTFRIADEIKAVLYPNHRIRADQIAAPAPLHDVVFVYVAFVIEKAYLLSACNTEIDKLDSAVHFLVRKLASVNI